MIRSSILASAALTLVLAAGCDKAADDQKKADNATAVANDKITSATVEANNKIASAQAEANRKIAEAQSGFMKLREDYRHDTMTTLANLDEKIAKLDAKELTATGQSKIDLDTRLPQIHAQRASFAADYKTLDSASATTWDDTKARLDKEMTDLKTLIDRQ